MSEAPEYYTIEGLADAAGKKKRQVYSHIARDVGGVKAARVKVPGLGVRFAAAKCRRYLGLCTAAKGGAK